MEEEYRILLVDSRDHVTSDNIASHIGRYAPLVTKKSFVEAGSGDTDTSNRLSGRATRTYGP